MMKLKSSEPFWLVKNGLINSYPSLRNDIEVDILIIGGGITGSLMAHQMIKDGYNTALIDRREIANGSTSATTSILQYEIDIPLYKLSEMIGKEAAEECYWACFHSIDDLAKIVKEVHSNCGFQKKDSLYYAAYKKDIKNLKKEFEARKQAGFPVKWMEATEIEKSYSIYNTFGGILSLQGGSMDAFRLTHDLLKFNQNRGLQIYDKTEIKSISCLSEKVLIETEFGNTITAKKIIYCNGYESTELIKEHFVDLVSTYAIIGEEDPKNIKKLNKLLVWNTSNPYVYMRTTDDNRVLIGGGDENFVNANKRDALLCHKEQYLVKQLKKICPDLEFRTDFVWAGTFGQTKDGLPYIGQHINFKNSYFLLGFGGNGITFSVIGTDIISKILASKTPKLARYFKFGR